MNSKSKDRSERLSVNNFHKLRVSANDRLIVFCSSKQIKHKVLSSFSNNRLICCGILAHLSFNSKEYIIFEVESINFAYYCVLLSYAVKRKLRFLWIMAEAQEKTANVRKLRFSLRSLFAAQLRFLAVAILLGGTVGQWQLLNFFVSFHQYWSQSV